MKRGDFVAINQSRIVHTSEWKTGLKQMRIPEGYVGQVVLIDKHLAEAKVMFDLGFGAISFSWEDLTVVSRGVGLAALIRQEFDIEKQKRDLDHESFLALWPTLTPGQQKSQEWKWKQHQNHVSWDWNKMLYTQKLQQLIDHILDLDNAGFEVSRVYTYRKHKIMFKIPKNITRGEVVDKLIAAVGNTWKGITLGASGSVWW